MISFFSAFEAICDDTRKCEEIQTNGAFKKVEQKTNQKTQSVRTIRNLTSAKKQKDIGKTLPEKHFLDEIYEQTTYFRIFFHRCKGRNYL